MNTGSLRLKMRNNWDVLFWTTVTVLIALATTGLIGWILLPPEVFDAAAPSMFLIALFLSSCMSLFACRQIMHLQLAHKTIKLLHATDALTGTTTRRRFFEAQAEMQAVPAMVMMVDVDHFKSINDRFGHPVGDEVLIQIAATLMENVQDRDWIVRMGGEEFLVFLPELDWRKAQELATELCSEVSRLRFEIDDHEIDVSISIGLAEHDAANPIDGAIQAADQALLKAKADGRNRWRKALRNRLQDNAPELTASNAAAGKVAG